MRCDCCPLSVPEDSCPLSEGELGIEHKDGMRGCRKPKNYMRMMECTALKYSRLLYEAGIAYTEEDVWSAYNGGYACGMEQGIEAERSRQG